MNNISQIFFEINKEYNKEIKKYENKKEELKELQTLNKAKKEELEKLKKEYEAIQNEHNNKQKEIQKLEKENELERKEKEELIKKYEESKNYIKNLDKEAINRINELINIEITEKNLIEAQLTNKENYTKINNKIDTSCDRIMKNPLTTKQYLKEITTLGTNLKNKIIYEAYNEPDKFIPLKETEKANMKETIFIEGILAKILITIK